MSSRHPQIALEKHIYFSRHSLCLEIPVYVREMAYAWFWVYASFMHLAPGPQACWEIISRASVQGNSVTVKREKKVFFNGEKWEAGEELAVAARIIDGNCWVQD